MTTKKLTSKERKKRLDLLEERIKSQKERPEYKENFEAIVSLFGENLDALRHYATEIAIQLNEVVKENEILCKKLNEEMAHARFFSAKKDQPNLTPQVKFNVAENIKKRFNMESASVDSFLAGVDVSKKTIATKGGVKRAEKFTVLKEYVVQEFSKRNWKSAMQARDLLWPKVQDEAQRIGFSLSESTGRETLYKWILSHQKNMRLLAIT